MLYKMTNHGSGLIAIGKKLGQYLTYHFDIKVLMFVFHKFQVSKVHMFILKHVKDSMKLYYKYISISFLNLVRGTVFSQFLVYYTLEETHNRIFRKWICHCNEIFPFLKMIRLCMLFKSFFPVFIPNILFMKIEMIGCRRRFTVIILYT